MLTKIKKVFLTFLVFMMMSPFIIMAKTIKPGESFTVTVGCGAIEGEVKANASNASIISSDNWCDRGRSISATAVANNVGTASISFSTVDATDTDAMVDASGISLGGGSVTVANPTVTQNDTSRPQSTPSQTQTNTGNDDAEKNVESTKSSDASLSTLTVSAGTLSPKFAANTTKYQLNLPSDTESIKVDAKANDSAASVSGTGGKELKQGDNTIRITVTAENGNTRTYTIDAYVEEKPEVYLSYHDQQLGVVKNTDRVSKPSDAFEETKLEIDGKEVVGWSNNIMNVTVLYMIDEESGEQNFYIYDTEHQSITSIFKPIVLLGNQFYIVDIDESLQTRADMTYTTVTVDENELPGWKFDQSGFDNYCVIYVMNEKGEMQYYQYEATQNTLQLYSNAAPITTETYQKNQQVEKIAIIAAGIFAVTTIGALIGCVMIRRRSNLKLRQWMKREE